MPKMIVSIDGVVIKEVQLTKDRTTLGRRPYNDIVIDNLAVSGEHAVLQMSGNEVYLEDLNSTNGTYINGKAVKKQLLSNNDVVEVGKYRIKFLAEEAEDYEKTMILRPGAFGRAPGSVGPQGAGSATPPAAGPASIKVLNGGAAGREVLLTKVVTTVGKPGVQVASVTKRPGGYVLSHVEGSRRPSVNGQPVGEEAISLKHGDIIDLAGTQMQFVQN
jgi:pSer/pThr/pTyr-binding forkhead associated (FHA) protein